MKVTSLLVLGSAAASQLVVAHTGSATATLRQHRRDLLKTLYARQDYPSGPSCQAGYDTPVAGQPCECGPGREQDGDLCVTPANAAAAFGTVQAPATPDFAVSNTRLYSGNAAFLDNNQCAAIALSLRAQGSRGYYIQPDPADSTVNQCWIIGDNNSDSPPFFASSYDGMPFQASGAAKRAVPNATNGAVGNGTGTVGFLGNCPAPNTLNTDGTCTCAAGYRNPTGDNTSCVLTASAAAGQRRRRAAVDNGASW